MIRIWNKVAFVYMTLNSYDTWIEYRLRTEDLRIEITNDDNISNT